MDKMTGLCLLESEIKQERWLHMVKNERGKIPSVRKIKQRGDCQRCGSQFKLAASHLIGGAAYCPFCIQLGRCQTNNFLYPMVLANSFVALDDTFVWDGQLKSQQRKAADKLVSAILNQRNLLIHGVTGAGKTEMLFPGLKEALSRQLKVAIVAPRVAVCLELYARLTRVFPNIPISLLYGGKGAVCGTTYFVIATAHQLMRFKNWFDVLIVDEIDAFPLYQNQLLLRNIEAAKSDKGVTVYLTATLTPELKQSIQNKTLDIVSVPLRFHRYLLPVPKCQIGKWHSHRRRLPKYFDVLLKQSLKKQQKLLIFCPSISMVEKVYELVKERYPSVPCACSHSQDSQREEKIAGMRRDDYLWFISTTILERGVTFYNIDVIVICANHAVFNEASLIQIAGRAGRDKNNPDGNVWFLCEVMTKAIKGSVQAIKEMNVKGDYLRRSLKKWGHDNEM